MLSGTSGVLLPSEIFLYPPVTQVMLSCEWTNVKWTLIDPQCPEGTQNETLDLLPRQVLIPALVNRGHSWTGWLEVIWENYS